jgi:transcriptional regulator with XRE-family HTH domain
MTLGERLKQERKRLGMTLADFAARGGIASNAQINYEQGSRQPRADYLASLDLIGVDVLYVVTGNRAPRSSIQMAMHEIDLIVHLQALDPSDQNAILGIATRLSVYLARTRENECRLY